jgi:Leucine-rich repeat (LRR) protein
VDVTPLADLDKLLILGAARNLISDIGPLRQLTAMETLDLSGNPLSAQAQAMVESLQQRGTAVVLESDTSDASPPPLAYDFSLIYTGRSRNNLTDLYRAPADGSAPPENITAAPSRYGDLALSPDYSRLAFVADAEFRDYWHMWVLETTASGMTKVNREATGPNRLVQLAWSPDNTRMPESTLSVFEPTVAF